MLERNYFLYSADHRFGFGPFLTFILLSFRSITSWFIIFYFSDVYLFMFIYLLCAVYLCCGYVYLCCHSFRNISFFSFKSSFKPERPSPVAVGLGFSIIKEEVLEHNYNNFISYFYSDKTLTYAQQIYPPAVFWIVKPIILTDQMYKYNIEGG